jgi:hypothetical protein
VVRARAVIVRIAAIVEIAATAGEIVAGIVVSVLLRWN